MQAIAHEQLHLPFQCAHAAAGVGQAVGKLNDHIVFIHGKAVGGGLHRGQDAQRQRAAFQHAQGIAADDHGRARAQLVQRYLALPQVGYAKIHRGVLFPICGGKHDAVDRRQRLRHIIAGVQAQRQQFQRFFAFLMRLPAMPHAVAEHGQLRAARRRAQQQRIAVFARPIPRRS